MIKAAVAGALGKMGKRIINILHTTDGIELSGGIEHKGHDLLERNIGDLLGLGSREAMLSSNVKEIISGADVTIDFSSPEASIENLRESAKQGKAMVIGTTGFSDDQKKEISSLSEKTPCVFAPNMSIGVNVLFNLLKYASNFLDDDYDVEIIEAHHRFKKDAPSGTALKIAEVLADSLGRNLEEVGKYCRKGMIGERPKKEIGIQTIRAGDIVGDHTVIFGGIGERLELTHKAHNRDTFAKGAVVAAKWIVGKKVGLYDMQDVLSLQ